jgi:hypothetical protein
MLSPSRSAWMNSEPLALRRVIVEPSGFNREGTALFATGGTGVETNIIKRAQTQPGKSSGPRVASVPDVLYPCSGNESEAEAPPKTSSRRQRSPRTLTRERFWLLHRWQGQILSVDPEGFDAQLFNPSDPTLIERATFQKSEINPDDLKLVRAGATFYWFIGYRDLPDRQRKRESVIWMKRGGHLDQERYSKELDEIKGIWGSIEWATPKSASGA